MECMRKTFTVFFLKIIITFVLSATATQLQEIIRSRTQLTEGGGVTHRTQRSLRMHVSSRPNLCVILGFSRGANHVSALLEVYGAYIGIHRRLWKAYPSHFQRTASSFKVEFKVFPETSLTKYRYTVRKVRGKRRSQTYCTPQTPIFRVADSNVCFSQAE